MKKIITVFCFFILFSSCGNNTSPQTTPVPPIDEAAIAKISQQLVIDSFDELFSNLDSTKISDYYTEDFLLLEHGVLWTNDSIVDFQRRSSQNPKRAKRLNKIDFISTKVYKESVWMAYHNTATFWKEEEQVGEVYWLESAVAVKEEEGWRLEMLHSTYVNK